MESSFSSLAPLPRSSVELPTESIPIVAPASTAKSTKKSRASEGTGTERKRGPKRRRTAAPSAAATTTTAAASSSNEPSDAAASRVPKAAKPPRNIKSMSQLSQDLPRMMHGFGDSVNPLVESVGLMEDMLLEYFTQVLRASMRFAQGNRLRTNDILMAIRKDKPKYLRAKRLLKLNWEIKNMRKMPEKGKG